MFWLADITRASKGCACEHVHYMSHIEQHLYIQVYNRQFCQQTFEWHVSNAISTIYKEQTCAAAIGSRLVCSEHELCCTS